MIVEVKRDDVFVPEYNGNRNEHSESQIKVHYRFLAAGERKRYVYRNDTEVYGDAGTAEKSDAGFRMKIVQDRPGLVRAMVTRIDNYGVSVDGSITNVVAASDLYTVIGVSQELVTEIEQAMVDASPEVDVNPT